MEHGVSVASRLKPTLWHVSATWIPRLLRGIVSQRSDQSASTPVSAAFTRSGVNGTSRSRAPVASKIGVADRRGDERDGRLAGAHGFCIRPVDQHALDASGPRHPA